MAPPQRNVLKGWDARRLKKTAHTTKPSSTHHIRRLREARGVDGQGRGGTRSLTFSYEMIHYGMQFRLTVHIIMVECLASPHFVTPFLHFLLGRHLCSSVNNIYSDMQYTTTTTDAIATGQFPQLQLLLHLLLVLPLQPLGVTIHFKFEILQFVKEIIFNSYSLFYMCIASYSKYVSRIAV